jgi:N-acetylglutamate synthase-like GNAT family acetyltransferase
MKITIKEDARRMSVLKRNTFRKINIKDYPQEVIEAYCKKQTAKKMLEHIKNTDIFILENKEKLIGMISLYDKNRIGSLFIRANKVGKGYGKKLINYVEKYAKKKGLDKIGGHAIKTSQQFIKKLGYEKTKEFTWWNIGGHKYKLYKVEKKLK